MPKNPSRRQARYLLSDVSPLTPAQKEKFKREIHGKHLRKSAKGSKKKKGR